MYKDRIDRNAFDMRCLLALKAKESWAKRNAFRIRMLWYDTLVTRRVEIEHYLGSIFSTTTRNGKLGFDLLGQRIRKNKWGTDTVTSITDYTEDTISNLSKVILHIYDKFKS